MPMGLQKKKKTQLEQTIVSLLFSSLNARKKDSTHVQCMGLPILFRQVFFHLENCNLQISLKLFLI